MFSKKTKVESLMELFFHPYTFSPIYQNLNVTGVVGPSFVPKEPSRLHLNPVFAEEGENRTKLSPKIARRLWKVLHQSSRCQLCHRQR
ncbi:hypothetical protein CEXT_725771 [Caerostris extrusa]|uniref:Uncharacterized protein n=1 Tax=Caerostris extrusa TaxID=172846 RepID=A0AAV4XSX6_CAEEX|nr:hypothetical protein CEXT_725771 [Caerostris extrusa]